MEKFKRIFLIVLDSVGIGAAPDAKEYGDLGANTLGNIAKYIGGLTLPHMGKLGLGNIAPIEGIPYESNPKGLYTKMSEASVGKDTMTGHWELMGLHIDQAFKTFPNGFPSSLINRLEEKTNRKVIGNYAASGTKIIQELGLKHKRTGSIIVYTSADSVMQIAAHEEVIPLDELYNICKIARELTLDEQYLVGRVIARPFIGDVDHFVRTPNRRDYALKPLAKTVLNDLQDNSYDVIALGKIHDIFSGEGITKSSSTVNNADGIEQLIQTMETSFNGLCFLNLVDFDAQYGHRRDPVGYAKALEDFDRKLPHILKKLHNDDLLMITADHGNDPTYKGTDHTREYVPLIVYSPSMVKPGTSMPIRETFADVGATIAHNFNVHAPQIGTSFLPTIFRQIQDH